MVNYAVLIDGGFAKRKLGTAKDPANARAFADLVARLEQHPALIKARLHRVYYYDALPLETTGQTPLGGPMVDFGKTPIAARSKALFDELGKVPYFSLRMGETQLVGWGINSRTLSRAPAPSLTIKDTDLRPTINQKGVDMRIGMDIAALTLKHQVQIIVLVTGDSDLVPAMKFARREGAQLFLCSLGHNVKPAMLEHSDLSLTVAV